jgi:hypothetical protein
MTHHIKVFGNNQVKGPKQKIKIIIGIIILGDTFITMPANIGLFVHSFRLTLRCTFSAVDGPKVFSPCLFFLIAP